MLRYLFIFATLFQCFFYSSSVLSSTTHQSIAVQDFQRLSYHEAQGKLKTWRNSAGVDQKSLADAFKALDEIYRVYDGPCLNVGRAMGVVFSIGTTALFHGLKNIKTYQLRRVSDYESCLFEEPFLGDYTREICTAVGLGVGITSFFWIKQTLENTMIPPIDVKLWSHGAVSVNVSPHL